MWMKFLNDPRAFAPEDETGTADAGDASEASLLSSGGGGEPPAAEGGEEGTVADGSPKPSEAPEPLTAESLTLPEGVEIAEETLTSFLSLMNDADLAPGERAQKLIDLQIDYVTKATGELQTQMESAWATTQKTWQDETRALPEIGGAALDKSLATIKKGLDQMGATPETYKALNMTGAGNNPEIIKMFYALTKNLSEGNPPAGSPTKGALSSAEVLYPSMMQKE